MVGVLRTIGVAVLLLGTAIAAVAGWLFAADTGFAEVAEAYARHPQHTMFQTEYWIAAVRHYGLLSVAVGGLVGGLVAGATLLGIAQILRRTPRG
jgi:hypothetical protein